MPQTPRLYLVLYDISKPRRWRKVFAALAAAGAWAQLSAFFCRMTPTTQGHLSRRLAELIDPATDRLLIIDLGVAESAPGRIQVIGPLSLPEPPKLRIL